MNLRFYVAFVCLVTSVPALAQSVNATISGTVTDATQSAVPNAEIALTSVSQRATQKAISNDSGFFSLPNLTPGDYEITISAPGFKQYVQKGISLLLNQQVRIDAHLEVGSNAETVNVSETVSPVNFNDAVRQEGVSGKQLVELPLVVSGGPRSSATFTLLLPGVTSGGTNNAFDARINGGLQTGQEAIMDGVSMQQGSMSQSGMISFFDFRMTPDMVSEFKVLTSNYEPQYGASTSAQMIVETKSGSDQFHGGLFEYLRNERLNSAPFRQDTAPKDKEHNFGGFLGGPLKLPIPGVFKGKFRTYFYTDIETFRATGGNNRPVITVPTAAMKRGDFSEWPDPIYDPATTRPDGTRSVFAGNIIPSSRIANSLANAWLKLVPDPNIPGKVKDNYRVPTPIPDGILANTNYYLVRGDHYLGEKDRVYVTIWHQFAPAKFNSLLPPQLADEAFSDPQDSWVNRVNWSHTFTPTLLNHWNIGYLNRNEGYGAISYQFADQFPKIPGVASNNAPPAMRFSDGYQGYGGNQGPNLGNVTTRPTWVTTDLVTWIKGNHTFKFGGEYRYLGQDFNSNTNEAGTFTFDSLTTGVLNQNSGNPIASFLLEQVHDANVDFRSVKAWGDREHALVIHAGDTWKARRNLSVNYGLRWDVFTPTYEHEDRFSFFDAGGANPAAGGRPGRVAFAGDKYGAASFGSRYPEEVWYGGFAPRLGIAYSLNNKTVVRTGYGIFFTQNYYPGWGGGQNLDGFNTNASFNVGRNIEPAFVLSQGFPQNFAKPPFIDPGVRNGHGILYRPKDANRRPYSQQWNLTIEREVPGNVLTSVAYVANKGTRLPSALAPLNALPLTELSRGTALNDVFQPGQTRLNGVSVPYTGWIEQLNAGDCKPTVAQALLPFPQYCDGLTGLNEVAGNSTYHSLQMKVEKRFSAGAYALIAYTWSKLITDVQSTNPSSNTGANSALGVISPFERQRNKALAQDDVPHVLSAAIAYELPFGRGKRLLSSSGPLNYLVGGWSVNVIFKASAGVPLFFRDTKDCSLIPEQFRLACIPAILPGKSPLLQDMNNIDVDRPVFDRSAFEPVGSQLGQSSLYYGSGSRITNLRGPRFTNTDFSVVKNVPFTVKDRLMNFQLRGEFFNLRNQFQFTTSGGQGDGGAFRRDLSDPEFGRWNGAVTSPRNIQLTARFTF